MYKFVGKQTLHNRQCLCFVLVLIALITVLTRSHFGAKRQNPKGDIACKRTAELQTSSYCGCARMPANIYPKKERNVEQNNRANTKRGAFFRLSRGLYHNTVGKSLICGALCVAVVKNTSSLRCRVEILTGNSKGKSFQGRCITQ